VSGKGVPAALFMTITRTLLKATAQFIAEPTRCVAQLNDLLAAENDQMMFVTLFYGVLHLESGHVRYVNAGHNPPYLLRGDGSVAPLARTGGVAVAVSEGFAYRHGSVDLQAGRPALPVHRRRDRGLQPRWAGVRRRTPGPGAARRAGRHRPRARAHRGPGAGRRTRL
jgi:hypothetical protein